MGWLTLAAIYFTAWWIVLFAVLPFGVKPHDDPEPGTAASAPARPMLARKFLWTSVISAVIVGAVWGLFAAGVLDWQALMRPPEGS
ncbi:DUF1467 family protein [Rhodospirillum centenum]|uniref:Transmembrane protein n=1 Tax=Rhodospirillum centenum (strain ATCC 51521 / SW) TaxID=414684 RepID=B6ISW3_RHOCS|nr:DUF1467 family protein [Rhodospirillum centenum]ACI98634.1 putative transmembrane protein [Rhodospirillum centenum SW]